MGNYLSNGIVIEHFQHLIVQSAFSVVLGNPLFDPCKDLQICNRVVVSLVVGEFMLPEEMLLFRFSKPV